jgi:tetratricopeptide (TPR) repeat protein
MPRLRRSPKAHIPHNDKFVGRVRELREFHNYIRYLLGHESPPNDDQIYPHFFLLCGEGGMGKSALLRQFYRIALGEGLPVERIIVIDLEYQQFPTSDSLAQVIIQSIKQQYPDFGRHYQQAQARRDELAPKINELHDHWAKWQMLREAGKLEEVMRSLRARASIQENQAAKFGGFAPAYLTLDMEEAAQELKNLQRFEQASKDSPKPFDLVLEQEFGSDARLFQSEQAQGKALREDLYELAETAPLLLMIDTYERADQHDEWFRLNILDDSSDQMLTVLAGRNNLKKDYERTFIGEYERYVKAYNLNERALESEEVRQYLKLVLATTDDLPDELVTEVQEISRGVPVAVEALANQLKEYGDIAPYRGMKFNGLDNRKVVRQVTERFLKYALADAKHDDQKVIERKLRDRQRIRALALLLRRDGDLASALWGVPPVEGEEIVLDLTRRYSFIFAGYGSDNGFASYSREDRLMHDLVREFVRKDTHLDWQHSFDRAALEEGLRRALPIIHERISQAKYTVTPADEADADVYEDLYEDESWKNAILDLLNALLWLGREDEAASLLLNRWIEASYYNVPFAEELVELTTELIPKSRDWRRLLRAMKEEQERDGFAQIARFRNLLEPHAQAVLCYLRAMRIRVWSLTDEDDLKMVNQQLALLEEGHANDRKWSPIHDGIADARYKRASYLFEQGDFNGAFDDCDVSLKFRPDDAASLTGRGAARARLGDQKGAIADWVRSLELRPDDWATLANLGDTKHNMGDLKGALADYDRLIELRPDDAELLANRANIKRSIGDLAGAREDYEHALEQLSNRRTDPDTLTQRGNTKFNMGNYGEALADYNRSLTIRPGDFKTLLSRGSVKHAMGDYAGALADYDLALALRPDDFSALSNRANTKRSMGDQDGAQADFERAIALLKGDADTPFTLIQRGTIKESMGDYEGALADYDRALASRPDDVNTLTKRASLKHSLGDYEGALADYELLLKLQPDNPETLSSRGSARQGRGDFAGAQEDLTKALELLGENLNDVEMLTTRGNVKHNMGDYAGALMDYNWALELRPQDPILLANRANTKLSMGDVHGALADYTSSLDRRPNDVQTLLSRGNLRFTMGDLPGAVADYNQALKLQPNSFDALISRGSTKRMLGDLTGATEDFNLSLEEIPEDDDDPDSLARRGVVKANMGELKAALVDYDRSLELRPDDHQTLFNRGFARHLFGDFAGALQDYERALKLRPGDLSVLSFRANTRLSLSDYAGALEDYDDILKAIPNDMNALINRAITAHSMGAADEFAQYSAAALTLSKELSDGYVGFLIEGIISLNKGEFSEALEHFQQALELRPLDVDMRINCGIMKDKLDNFTGALDDFEQALLIAPQQFHIISCRGGARYKLGDLEGALADFDNLLMRTTDHALTFTNRSLVRYRLGDLKGAAQDLNAALRLNPADSGTMYNVACYYALAGKVAEVVDWLSQAIKIEPSLRDSASRDDHFQALRASPQFMTLFHH